MVEIAGARFVERSLGHLLLGVAEIPSPLQEVLAPDPGHFPRAKPRVGLP
jgi:hypothetical protein